VNFPISAGLHVNAAPALAVTSDCYTLLPLHGHVFVGHSVICCDLAFLSFANFGRLWAAATTVTWKSGTWKVCGRPWPRSDSTRRSIASLCLGEGSSSCHTTTDRWAELKHAFIGTKIGEDVACKLAASLFVGTAGFEEMLKPPVVARMDEC